MLGNDYRHAVTDYPALRYLAHKLNELKVILKQYKTNQIRTMSITKDSNQSSVTQNWSQKGSQQEYTTIILK